MLQDYDPPADPAMRDLSTLDGAPRGLFRPAQDPGSGRYIEASHRVAVVCHSADNVRRDMTRRHSNVLRH